MTAQLFMLREDGNLIIAVDDVPVTRIPDDLVPTFLAQLVEYLSPGEIIALKRQVDKAALRNHLRRSTGN